MSNTNLKEVLKERAQVDILGNQWSQQGDDYLLQLETGVIAVAKLDDMVAFCRALGPEQDQMKATQMIRDKVVRIRCQVN